MLVKKLIKKQINYSPHRAHQCQVPPRMSVLPGQKKAKNGCPAGHLWWPLVLRPFICCQIIQLLSSMQQESLTKSVTQVRSGIRADVLSTQTHFNRQTMQVTLPGNGIPGLNVEIHRLPAPVMDHAFVFFLNLKGPPLRLRPGLLVIPLRMCQVDSRPPGDALTL